jgi:hypothetical protein
VGNGKQTALVQIIERLPECLMDVPLTDRLRYAGGAITALLMPRGTAAGPILLLAEMPGELEAYHQLATMRAAQEPIIGILGGAAMGIAQQCYPLYDRECLTIDDGRVMVADIVLGHQQVAVLDPAVGEMVGRIILLHPHIPDVLLVLEHRGKRMGIPLGPSHLGDHTVLLQCGYDGGKARSVLVHVKDPPYLDGLVLLDHPIALPGLAVAVGGRPLGDAGGKTLADAPLHVFRKAVALFLCDRRHQGEIQLRSRLGGIDVVTLEEHRYPEGLEPACSGEGVYGVACKALDRLDQDDVDLAGLRIGHQGIEPVTVAPTGAGLLIGIDTGKLPIGMAGDHVVERLHLGRQAALLLLELGGDAAVRRHPLRPHLRQRTLAIEPSDPNGSVACCLICMSFHPHAS